METLYPIYYGTRMVTFEDLVASFDDGLHPEENRRGFNFIKCQGGRIGIGEGYRATQPDKPGFAPQGKSFHGKQQFPSGLFYIAWDLVVVNPGGKHRAPYWSEVPEQGTQLAEDYGVHCNVSGESWHLQPIEIDGYDSWVSNGKQDIQYNYPIRILAPPTPTPTPPAGDIMAQFVTRELVEGMSGSDVKFYQGQMNDIAGQGLQLDGQFGPKTKTAVENWQRFFKATSDGKALTVDGKLGPLTQQSIIEVSLAVT